jgi:hypothetical protein
LAEHVFAHAEQHSPRSTTRLPPTSNLPNDSQCTLNINLR